jgi:CrcB protein
MIAVGVAAAAAGGAVVRWRLSPFGWRATWLVNVLGSFVLGLLLASAGPSSDVTTVLGVGFCGSLTTYGTFALEVSAAPVRLRAVIVAANLVGCVLAATAGWALA